MVAMNSFPPAIPHRMESMRGPGYSNWVIKNHILCGPHPGSTTVDIVKNVTKLLEAGVTTFVCLQHEMPTLNITSRTFSGKGAPPSSRARSAFGDGVVVHAKPYLEDAQTIAGHAHMPQVSRERPLAFLHLPIPDANGSTVTDDVLSQFVVNLVSVVRSGDMLYIQCADGNGRTGTVCALLLGVLYGLTGSEALDLVQRCREHRYGAHGVCPETHEQKMQVRFIAAPVPSTSLSPSCRCSLTRSFSIRVLYTS